MSIPRIRFVLLRPRSSGNLGAAARALKNFGFSDWVWVRPQTQEDDEARRMAVQAEDVLRRARVVDTLDEAVADCVWVVGTSSRKVDGRRRLAPRELAEELLARSAEDTCALVFGDERSGLTNEELWRCHDFSAVRAHEEQPSLNLSQAILLYAYELHEAGLRAVPPPPRPLARAAPDGALAQLEAVLRTTLEHRGVIAGGERHIVRDLFETLRRSRLSVQEAQLWLAALHVMDKGRTPR